MTSALIEFLKEHSSWAIFISLGLSVLVAIIGILPSFFITAANIAVFGFWEGTLLSFAGETLGAGLAFLLYRKGFKDRISEKLQKYPKAVKLLQSRGKEAFGLIFSLRLLPFVPSGLVTFAAASSAVSFTLFFVASSLGKIPALLIEAYSVYQVGEGSWQGKLILLVVALVMLAVLVKKRFRG